MIFVNRGYTKMAVRNLRSAKSRSLLTMFGVVVGIVAVVTVVGIGDGIKAQVAQQIDHFGKDLITIRPGQVALHGTAKNLVDSDSLFGTTSLSGLTTSDFDTVQHSSGVGVAAPLGEVLGNVQSDEGETVANDPVIATNADLPAALNQSIAYGGFFDESDEGSDVAVIGANVAQALFQENVPLGHKFTFRGATFTIRGIFSSFANVPLSPASTFNDAIFIPYQTAEQLTSNTMQLYSVLAKPKNPDATAQTISTINNNLLTLNRGQPNFSVLNVQQTLEAGSSVLSLLTELVSGVAAVSLIVGGVGIMNVMLVSVTERMHEIGVRKALGATNRQILQQFMLEATVLSLAGGALGMIFALLINFLLRTYTGLHPVVSWQALVVATVVSVALGIIFGVAPAIKAARKDPIDALRHE